jgi:putative transposase
MCRVLGVHPSGFYAWLYEPRSQRKKDDEYLLVFIKQFWLESGAVYCYRKIYKDMLASGEQCGKNGVYRIMREAGIQSQRGYKHKAHYSNGEVLTIAPNLLNREFDVTEPNKVWVTDITYIRTYEGWLFLGVVIDLFLRQVVSWSMSERINTDLVLDGIAMACWRRKPKAEVLLCIQTKAASTQAMIGAACWKRAI